MNFMGNGIIGFCPNNGHVIALQLLSLATILTRFREKAVECAAAITIQPTLVPCPDCAMRILSVYAAQFLAFSNRLRNDEVAFD